MNIMTNMTQLARWPGDPKIVKTGPSSMGTSDRLARLLGWFSIGLGIYELVQARQLARTLGLEGKETLIRGYGAREISAGILSLSVNSKAGMVSRVAGDAIDVATLVPGLDRENPKRNNVVTALALVMGVTALDVIALGGLTRRHARRGTPRDFGDRSGFPQGIERARAAAANFQTPPDLRAAPEAAGASRVTGRRSKASLGASETPTTH